MIDNYENLANAIVLQAVRDYRIAKKILLNNSKNTDARRLKNEVVRFFKSEWFKELVSIDGEKLLNDLEEEI